MWIFYGEAVGKANVPSDAPVDEPYESVIGIFRRLDSRRGFLSIVISPRFALQMMPRKGRGIQIELLDRSGPAFDTCVVTADFAEKLIESAGKGEDIFAIARQKYTDWEHVNLPKKEL